MNPLKKIKENIMRNKQSRNREPEKPFAIVDFTEEAKDMGGGQKHIVVYLEQGTQIYPLFKCYVDMLEDAEIPVIDLTFQEEAPWHQWEERIMVKESLGVDYV